MPNIATITSWSKGVCGRPPRQTMEGSPNVFAESDNVHRQTDEWLIHCNPAGCHTGRTARGSSTVYCNGLQVARIDDPITCGDEIATGKPTVFVGG